MKRFVLLLFTVFLYMTAFAQLEVKEGSFHKVDGFVNINLDKMTDDNEQPYAVLKIKTENIGSKERRELNFGGDARTFFEAEYKDGEVWLYISYYASYIKISHEELSSTEFYFPFDMEPKCGYELTLVNKANAVVSGWAALIVTTKPENGAKILLNGRDVNAITPYTNNMIPSGKYEITVSKYKFVTTTKTVEIKDGENKDVEIEMQYVFGKLFVGSEPSGATILIDGRDCGVTPAEINNIVVGTHELRLEKTGCAQVTKTITLDEINKLTVNEKLEAGREISISTDKNGDQIFVDGNYLGVSPLTATLRFGEHEITAIRGYNGDINALKDFNGGTLKGLNAINGVNGIKATAKTVTVSQTGGANSVQLTFSIGAINGVFSVSSSKKVQFSQGNLQYQASTKTWRFAEHQWDMIGDANKNISSRYSGWIDLFGWGTGNKPTKRSTNISSYSSFTDWGKNTISNGGGKSWFTLTNDEWEYVFNTRSTSSGIRYAKAIVNGVNGVILLPDNWSISNYSLSNTNKYDAGFSSNRISQSDWTNKLEANGAVFLPAAGYRSGTTVDHVGSYGHYWSASYSSSYSARSVQVGVGGHGPDYCNTRQYCGLSVRPVCPSEN